jgi:hypothetical protein
LVAGVEGDVKTPHSSHRWKENDKTIFRRLVALGYEANWTAAIRKATREALESLEPIPIESAIRIAEEPAP